MNSHTKKRFTLRLLAGALALTLAGCGGGGDGGDLGASVPFSEIENTTLSAIKNFETAQVTTQEAWAALWARHKANFSPVPALPAVDFSKSMVGAIFLGDGSLCDRVQVQSVAFENQTNPTLIAVIRVSYRVIKPGPADICAAGIGQPTQIIRIEHAAAAQLKFVKVD
jgi:hypothetical protein